jgi:phage-related protein
MGYAIYVAQQGGKHRDAKVLTGFGRAGVLEVVKDFRRDTFRAVNTLRLAGPCMCCMRFRRNQRQGERHHDEMSS